MRAQASVLHLDLDAFFAAVEQRDKPSLRGKPVIVGGVGQRGVVSTASYEARVFGVRSAMPMHEARRRCPHAAFLSGRFGAYRQASGIVMGLLRELSPLVEPLSLDEAFVDLAVGDRSLAPEAVLAEVATLRARLTEATGGLTASVGVGSSKFIAKVASELAKPDGVRLVAPGTEVETIAPLPARAIPGIGPVTMEKLYDDVAVELVDGGVHDNQGIASLLDQTEQPDRIVLALPRRSLSAWQNGSLMACSIQIAVCCWKAGRKANYLPPKISAKACKP